jgi:hypothetical protein
MFYSDFQMDSVPAIQLCWFQIWRECEFLDTLNTAESGWFPLLVIAESYNSPYNLKQGVICQTWLPSIFKVIQITKILNKVPRTLIQYLMKKAGKKCLIIRFLSFDVCIIK